MARDFQDLLPLGLEEVTGGHWLAGPPAGPIRGAAIDSRLLLPGQLFVAIRSDRDDGHRYLEEALRAGAAAALVQEPRPRIPLAQLCVDDTELALLSIAAAYRATISCPIVAVAGSYGKTTVKDLLATLLGRETCHATEGNWNNCRGMPLTLLGFRANVHRHAVLEVGISKPGEMGALASTLRPSHVIFTALSHKHGEFFPSQRHLLEEKLRIAEFVDGWEGTFVTTTALASDPALDHLRHRMVCVDDRANPIPAPTNVPCLSFFRDGCSVAIHYPGESTPRRFSLPRPSDGFAQNFALCHAMAWKLGVSDGAMADRLTRWRWPDLRGQIFYDPVRSCVYYVDCYNSDLPSLVDAGRTFARLFPKSPRLFVIGGMSELGTRSDTLHREAGMALPFLPGDRFFLLGRETHPLRAALLSRSVPEKDAILFEAKEELQQALATFRGTIFFKGSRCYALESLIDLGRCLPVLPGTSP
ncbi:MAG: UDP-N-acetylmuramoyl-tripeptide--D-alanyl-D-alanine ligase [Puniceicoccales bacterium]|nr:UDP-N-acetylmuramoyl-tripeptide--D-alanyl-D-alanine ligase [Puniceicoccales bacterium]